ncbi:MOB kinase activator 3B isoform X1 [Paramuricea clavata]|uniref:MOB kinase activator 3B isoform X1 n=1 Tax=Paramuricea clavata TaxID=317549 RepID=A0A7D9LGL4_PARCT|nr:MOB kinase activator 3B isoform X1 [Paramuricea clavata]
MATSLTHLFSKDRTFRPKKKWDQGSLRHGLHKQAKATLQSGLDLRSCVKLPPNETLEDWIAVHVVDFFNRVNLIYGTVSEFCTSITCPVMSGGPKYEYHWSDGTKSRKPRAVSAPEYMELLMAWIETLVNNPDIFPPDDSIPFPKAFLPTCKKVLTRLFRVFVHVYIHHFEKMVSKGAEAHVNQCYKHFYFFVTEFSLVDKKELEPLVSNC